MPELCTICATFGECWNEWNEMVDLVLAARSPILHDTYMHAKEELSEFLLIV